MKVTVLIPSYRRPDDLARCLKALQRQLRPADQVLVVVRPEDYPTHTVLAEPAVRGQLALDCVTIDVKGLVAALNRGLDAAKGDIIAITDDDAAPRPDWLQRIEAAFASDPKLGGVGGRDWVHERGRVLDGQRQLVGKVLPTGKIIGNHHLGVGEAREVDLLKGANMSYRRAALEGIRFDERLRGTGAQIHNDMAFSMRVKRAGWKLIYDPKVAVDHFPAPRLGDDQRTAQSELAMRNAAYNLHLTLREFLPPIQRAVAWWWWMLVGTRSAPGLVHPLMAITSKEGASIRERWRATRLGARDARRMT
ncbi:glycosyltransferase family 2 protein [Trinickia caryophylli]|uniref:Glycosyltransferase like family 2 n=1 Tax=Trinickia caryophylli TaxID=28094 RepID=A0A1X7FNV4_TRICW|nr:glycosyltransferase family 2 protein [Trinickia caryophylli]PMS13902.1 glycosyl transferase [Trinickia caryophylli]TRX14400.1 glycosyltransferase family 2 protein [Trinickia caryophylli]WQE14237.1 glycosyltransferase family 2 protein [Trinickia caryophylli]SMF55925.1 Glycosyltransferase like family 2 [Trinickia caryophylli]GLU33253.1 glycosyl transferase [Trinickia caryophylli]